MSEAQEHDRNWEKWEKYARQVFPEETLKKMKESRRAFWERTKKMEKALQGEQDEENVKEESNVMPVIPELPRSTTLKVCPLCKYPIQDDAHGWLRSRTVPGKAVPCHVCTPRVRAIKASRTLASKMQMFGGSNIPDFAATWNFASYPPEGDLDAKEDVEAFAARRTGWRGLYLWGDGGRGKTSLAISCLKEALQRGESALFLRVSQYLRYLKQAELGLEQKTGIALLDLAFTVQWLVVDEIGIENPSEYSIRQFYDLVEERRGQRGLYTIFTSNCSIDDLEERWRPKHAAPGDYHAGSRVASRLREYCFELEIVGVNLRDRLNRKNNSDEAM